MLATFHTVKGKSMPGVWLESAMRENALLAVYEKNLLST